MLPDADTTPPDAPLLTPRPMPARLRRGDPVATRVKLRKPDAAASLIGALRWLP